MTIETSCSEARGNLKFLMDTAVENREVIVIHRRSGGSVAMIAADELDGLMETAHLLRSPKNAQRLLAALSRARSGDVEPVSLGTLTKELSLES